MKWYRHVWTGLVVLALALLAVYLGGVYFASRHRAPSGGGPMMGPGLGHMGSMHRWQPATFKSNGERIYFTAVDEQGKRISFAGGPAWVEQMGGSCADCHGVHGTGGTPVMMGTAVSPDIRYDVLTGKEPEHGAGEEHMDHPPYTEALIKRAITQGLDPAGEPLDPTMPRFNMSARDIDDLVSFLKQLDHGGEEEHP